jgi:hypothetical protein
MLRVTGVAAAVMFVLLFFRTDTQAVGQSYVVDRTDDTPGANACTAAPNDCSLRGAMDNANANPGADIITLPAAMEFVFNIPTTSDDANAGGDLDILDSVTINGNGSILHSGIPDRVIDVFPSGGTGSVVLNDMTIRDGLRSTGDGGGIRVTAGTFSANNLTVKENTADGNGGGIAFDARVDATLTNFTADHNTAAANVDGVVVGGGVSVFQQSDDQVGGGSLHIVNSIFKNNLAHRVGGGLGLAGNNTLTIENTDFTSNSTDRPDDGGGGGIAVVGGPVTITGGEFQQNTSANQAGAMFLMGDGTVSSVLFNDNGAPIAGGIRAASEGTAMFDHVTISNNVATDSIGGIDLIGIGRLSNSDVSGNRAGNHGGGVVLEGTDVTVDHSVIASNKTTTGDGAGILVPGGGATIENSTINANSAHGSGGGIFVGVPPGYNGFSFDPAPVDLRFSTVDANASLSGGANIHDVVGDSQVSLFASLIAYSGAQPNCNMGLNSLGNNIEDANSCSLNTTTDIKNTDPLIGALTNNGGLLRSQALAADSPARDSVLSGCPPPVDDQRGFGRPVNVFCDAGAFEFGATPGTFTPTPSPTHSPTPSLTHSPTASPSPTSTNATARIWGDVNCVDAVNILDALSVFLGVLGIPVTTAIGCPDFGQSVSVDGVSRQWGDNDCDGDTDGDDALPVLAFVAETPIAPTSGCPKIGDVVLVGFA